MRGLTKASAPTGSVRRARGFLLVVCIVCGHRACMPWWLVCGHVRTHAGTFPHRLPHARAKTVSLYALLRVHRLSGKHDLRHAPSAPPLFLFGPRPKPDCGPTVHGTHKQPASSRSFARRVVGAYAANRGTLRTTKITLSSYLSRNIFIEPVESKCIYEEI